MQNSDFWIRTTSLYGSQTSPVDLRIQNIVNRMTLVYWSQRSSGVLCIQNSAFSIRITSLYGSQHSSVVFALQNSDFWIRITSLYGSQTSTVFCAWKTTWLALELLVSMGPRPHLSFCACKMKWLELELPVSMGPSPLLWFFIQNSDIRARITTLYGSNTSSMVFEFKTAPFGSELLVSMGPIPHLSFCACETAWLAIELLVSMGPSPHLWFLHAKSNFWIRTTSL